MLRLAALAGLALSLAAAACGGVSHDGAGPPPAGVGAEQLSREAQEPAPVPPTLEVPSEPEMSWAPEMPSEPPAPPIEPVPAGLPTPATEPSAVPAPEPQPAADEATLWVTRDGGSELVVEAAVPAGLTVIQALDRVAEIETRHGGRYVQSIEGIEGDLVGQEDWFFLVNGIEPDLGAAEVRVRAGDIVWWDFRSWVDPAGHPAAAVGAFPEPLIHGWEGQARPVEVRAPEVLSSAAAALRELVGRSGLGKPHLVVLEVDDAETGATFEAEIGRRNGSPVTFRLHGSRVAVEAAALRLARDPAVVRFRYTARFDGEGEILE